VTPADLTRRYQANADALRWQNTLRFGVVATTAVLGLALQLAGVLVPSPLAARATATPLVAQVELVAVYLAVVAALRWWVGRSGKASPATVGAVTGADLTLLFGSTFLLTPPTHYDRVLILAFFGTQVTQLYFRRTAANWMLGATAAGYLVLLGVARALGAPIAWGAELWTLVLFATGAAILLFLQGNQSDRLDRLVAMFERTEEGDFGHEYDVAADKRPDGITLVGRAYNQMRNQLATIVLTEPLSGCLNRRGFEQQLAREAARASRSASEIALIAVDVDFFKMINDTFGHLAGDEVIREVGQLLRETARSSDIVARTGGEEFVILIPGAGAAAAFQIASRIVEAFRRRSFTGVQGKLPVTASVGVVADKVRDTHMAEALKARADEALYAAKRAGRNRVVMWTHGMTTAPVQPEVSPSRMPAGR
jgi:diguanylate cyclase (GGDEF)-like protein